LSFALNEFNKHINQLLDGQDQDLSGAEGASEDRNPGIPQHTIGAFYQPEPETLEDGLARIVYVTMDLDGSLGLSAPSLRGKRCNWIRMTTVTMSSSK
jgi:hypothetical protein